jgi:pimeloyl-ACP methyl ester carboxylesterase
MYLRRALVLLGVLLLCASVAFGGEIQDEVFPLERNGIPLHLERYQLAGGDIKGQLLLVHGLTYSSHEFDVDYKDYSFARFFARNGYAVWLLDIAGYGSSGAVADGFMPNSDYAAEDIHTAVQVILKTAGVKDVYVLGWSWGTVTSGRYAAKYPDEVRKLVLYAPILTGLGAAGVTEPFHANTWLHAAGDFQLSSDNQIDYDITDPIVVHVYLSNSWKYDGKGSPNGGRRDLMVDPSVRLIPTEKLTIPTLLIGGDKDDYINVDIIREAGKSLPQGSAVEIVSGAAHPMMMEKPYYKAFRDTVLRFLQK